jgi:predicted RNA-binding Zn-ribbon protein involved in translation (DUF1610 family)
LACNDVAPGSYFGLIADDPKTVCVFEYLIRQDKNELVPAFEASMGYYYPDIVKNCGITAKESVEISQKIISLSLGAKVYHDQVLKCQACVADQVSVRFHCPFCNSTEIDKELLIEHTADGVMALLSSFKKKEGKLICPGCGKTLEQEGKDYRNVGIWYGCLSCKKQFDTPKVKYVCRTCSKDIDIQDVMISAVYRVVIKKEVIDELSTRLLICKPVSDALMEIKLNPSMPGILEGKSGINHTFGIMGTNKNKKTVAIDLAISKSKINEGPILAMSAKVMDTNPTKAIIIAVPGLQDNARKVAGIYNIIVIEGDTVEDATKQLRKLLTSDAELMSSAEAAEEAPAPVAVAATPPAKGKKGKQADEDEGKKKTK